MANANKSVYAAVKNADTARLHPFAATVLSVNSEAKTVLVDIHGIHDKADPAMIGRIDRRLCTFNLATDHVQWDEMVSGARLILPAQGISTKVAYTISNDRGDTPVFRLIGLDRKLIVVTNSVELQDLTVTKTIESKTIKRAMEDGANDAPMAKRILAGLGKAFAALR